MAKLVNLTKYHVNLYPKDGTHIWIPPSGKVAAVEVNQVYEDEVNGVPIYSHEYMDAVNLPDPEEGTTFIVPEKVLEAFCEERDDLVAVDSASAAMVRSEGKIIGVRSFFRYPKFDNE